MCITKMMPCDAIHDAMVIIPGHLLARLLSEVVCLRRQNVTPPIKTIVTASPRSIVANVIVYRSSPCCQIVSPGVPQRQHKLK